MVFSRSSRRPSDQDDQEPSEPARAALKPQPNLGLHLQNQSKRTNSRHSAFDSGIARESEAVELEENLTLSTDTLRSAGNEQAAANESESADEFDFSPDKFDSNGTPGNGSRQVHSDEESRIQSPHKASGSALTEVGSIGEKKSVGSSDDEAGDKDSNRHREDRQRIYVGAIVALIVILVPCFVMMVYLFAVRNHLISQLEELGVPGNLPMGATALKTLHPVILYDQHDSVLLDILGQPVQNDFAGLSYRPSCNSSQLEMARQLAALSRHTDSILLERSGCETTREEALMVLESLNVDVGVSIVCEISKLEDETISWVYDTIQLVRAFPKSMRNVLLKPLNHVNGSEIEACVIYLKRQLAVRRQGVGISVYPAFDVWSRDLLSLVEVIGINYNPTDFGSKPEEVSDWIVHDLSSICQDLPLKEFLVTGIGWSIAEASNSEQLSLEFRTKWVCEDARKLPSRVQWFYESELDGTRTSLKSGLFNGSYQLRHPINCAN